MAVYVIRGLTNPAISLSSESTWNSTGTAPSTVEAAPAVAVGYNQVVLGVAAAGQTGSTVTFPAAGAVPTFGYTIDRGGTSLVQMIHRRIVGQESSAQIGISYTHATLTNVAIACLMLVCGEAAEAPAVGAAQVITIPDVSLPAAGTINLTTPVLQLGDLVMLCISRGSTGSITVTGLGGSWTDLYQITTNIERLNMRYRVPNVDNATGTITITTSVGAYVGHVKLYVIRGLQNPRAIVGQQSVWDNTTTPAGVVEKVAGLSIGANQVAILCGCASGTVSEFVAEPEPAGAYTVDCAAATDRKLYTASFVSAAAQIAGGGIKTSSTSYTGVAMAVTGEAFAIASAPILALDDMAIQFREAAGFVEGYEAEL
jgi:hypothetical protein